MANKEVVELEIKTQIGSAKKQIEEVNNLLEEQKAILFELQQEEIKLQQERLGMSEWEKSLSNVDTKLKHLNLSIKDQKLAVKQLTTEQKDNNRELKESNQVTKESIGDFKLMGVSLNGLKASFSKIIPTIKLMFGSIRAGIISTGIGALVLAVISLMSWFTKTKKGAEFLEKAFAGIGAVVTVITDLFSAVGEKMVSAFKDPKQAISDLWEAIKTNLMNRLEGLIDGFKAAGKVIKGVLNFDWDAVKEGATEYGQALIQVGTGLDVEQQQAFLEGLKNITKEMAREAKAMIDLTDRLQRLKDAEREFSKEKALANQQIAKARLLSEDETISLEKRKEALEEAINAEKRMLATELEQQRERVAIFTTRKNMSNSTAEDLEELAAEEVKLIELETQSFTTQKKLKRELNSLDREILADKQRIADEKQKILDDEFDAFVKANDEWNKENLRQAAKDLKIAEKAAKEKIALDEEVEKAKQTTIGMGFDILGELTKKSDKAQKAVAVAKTIYNTQQAIMNAMANVPAPYNVLQAMATGIMGALSIKNILATSPGTSNLSVPTPGIAGTPAPQMLSGKFELGGGQEQQPVQAYVVTDNLTDNQNKLAYIRRRATI